MPLTIDNITSEGLTDTASYRVQATVVATANTTTTLTVSSVSYMIFTGSVAGQIIKLGSATTYSVGHTYLFHNTSSASVSVQDGASSALATVATNQRVVFILQNNTTTAGIWVNNLTTNAAGTVTSVGLSLPSIFTVSGSPITSSGTLTGTLNTQTANFIFSGPASGAAAIPTFRLQVLADLPQLTNGQLYIGSTGAPVVAASLTAGTGVTITPGAGSITIAATNQTGTGLKLKAGTVAAGSFSGSPKTVAITFASAFTNTNYTINITGTDVRQWSWSSKATTGFTIQTNSNRALTGNVDWQAQEIGESN